MKGSAPYWPFVGFQVVEKIFQPWLVNHDAACWLVETAIRTRITSTSRPEASARIWKPRSPSGRRCDRGADPAVPAGSAFTAVLTISNRSGPYEAEPILLSCAWACCWMLEGSGA